jgi:hypothetical protein
VTIANKVFKTMCLSAQQMKGLSELFPNDETKYNFLSMAYPFAADTEELQAVVRVVYGGKLSNQVQNPGAVLNHNSLI